MLGQNGYEIDALSTGAISSSARSHRSLTKAHGEDIYVYELIELNSDSFSPKYIVRLKYHIGGQGGADLAGNGFAG